MNRQIDILRSHPTHQADLLDHNAGEMAEELAAARARIRELESERETYVTAIKRQNAALQNVASELDGAHEGHSIRARHIARHGLVVVIGE